MRLYYALLPLSLTLASACDHASSGPDHDLEERLSQAEKERDDIKQKNELSLHDLGETNAKLAAAEKARRRPSAAASETELGKQLAVERTHREP